MNPSGERGTSDIRGFVQQSPPPNDTSALKKFDRNVCLKLDIFPLPEIAIFGHFIKSI